MKGLELAKKIGLELGECKKIFEPINCKISLSELEKILQEKFQNSQAVFVAWQIQNIIWGKYDGGKIFLSENISPDVEFFLECRIFNENEELHLKKIDGEFRGRYVRDEVGMGNFFADSFSRLWGEKISAENNFVNLLDAERKIFMKIPCDETNAKYYGLLTRNYIDSDEKTGLSGYVDYRFVSIESAEEV